MRLVRTPWPLLAAVALLALFARLAPALRNGQLQGVGGFDDGVYTTASRMLWLGELPYQHYTFVHPPGIIVLLSPATALEPLIGDAGVSVLGRVLIALIGSTTAVLITRLAWRYGTLASVVAGCAYALIPAMHERVILMEAPLNCALVLAACALRLATRRHVASGRRWLWFAGLALAAALTVKLWAAGPIVVMAGFVAVRFGWRSLGRLASGLALGVGVLIAPFVAPAPLGAFGQMVFAQAKRWRSPKSLGWRFGLFDAAGPTPLAIAIVAVTMVLGAVVVVGLLRQPSWRRRLTEPVAWAAVGTTCVAELLVSPSYFTHYDAFVWPWLALLAAVGIGWLQGRTEQRTLRHTTWWRALRAPVAVVAVALIVSHSVPSLRDLYRSPRSADHGLAEMARSAGCRFSWISSDLVAANAVTESVERGCPFPVDSTGIQLVLESGGTPPEQWVANRVREDNGSYGGLAWGALRADIVFASQAVSRQLELVRRGYTKTGEHRGIGIWRPPPAA